MADGSSAFKKKFHTGAKPAKNHDLQGFEYKKLLALIKALFYIARADGGYSSTG